MLQFLTPVELDHQAEDVYVGGEPVIIVGGPASKGW